MRGEEGSGEGSGPRARARRPTSRVIPQSRSSPRPSLSRTLSLAPCPPSHPAPFPFFLSSFHSPSYTLPSAHLKTPAQALPPAGARRGASIRAPAPGPCAARGADPAQGTRPSRHPGPPAHRHRPRYPRAMRLPPRPVPPGSLRGGRWRARAAGPAPLGARAGRGPATAQPARRPRSGPSGASGPRHRHPSRPR